MDKETIVRAISTLIVLLETLHGVKEVKESTKDEVLIKIIELVRQL